MLTWCSGRYGSYANLDEAKSACLEDSNCASVYDRGCDDEDVFELCSKVKSDGEKGEENPSGHSCLYVKQFKQKMLTYCTNRYGSYETSDEAKTACLKDASCISVYDRRCDDKDSFHLCSQEKSVERTSKFSCLYVKQL